ncbi:MAG: hypothetical protein ACD_79C00911G0008 [uncultured bacterium]|nr:MAG: hypothetical protein ACD_79C00911G0008 [uncultured bacterium]
MAKSDQPFKDEKTEAPSPKRMQKQRSQGNVFMSQDMATALIVMLGIIILKVYASWIFNHLYLFCHLGFTEVAYVRLDEGNFVNYISSKILLMGKLLAPVLFFLFLAGSFSTISQTGWVVSWSKIKWDIKKAFKMDWQSMNPFDSKKVLDLGLNIIKVIILGTVLYLSLKDSIDDWIPLMDGPVINVWFFLCNLSYDVILKIGIAMFLLAIIDFLYKRKKFIDDLKMTKYEVKEERRMADGDPRVKAALRSKRLALFRRIMMEAVPQADVVITNPTHIAVALKYEPDSMEAPKVVAKGIGKLAEKIKEIARKHDIPTVENKPLAQVLFKTVEVGAYIPVSLYKTVAEILAYVYKLKNKKAA